MKTWRTASLISGVIGLLTIAFILSIPLRFPGFDIFWHPILASFIPIVVIIGILPLRLRLSHSPFSILLIFCTLLFIGLSIFGDISWIFLALLLAPLVGMYIASRALKNTAA